MGANTEKLPNGCCTVVPKKPGNRISLNLTLREARQKMQFYRIYDDDFPAIRTCNCIMTGIHMAPANAGGRTALRLFFIIFTYLHAIVKLYLFTCQLFL